MTKLHVLNAYLTERLAVVVREILDMVEDTVSEYREETARVRIENDHLKRQLRNFVLVAKSDVIDEVSTVRQQEGLGRPQQYPQTTDMQQSQVQAQRQTEHPFNEEATCQRGEGTNQTAGLDPSKESSKERTSPAGIVPENAPHHGSSSGWRAPPLRLRINTIKTEPEEAEVTVTLTESDLHIDSSCSPVPKVPQSSDNPRTRCYKMSDASIMDGVRPQCSNNPQDKTDPIPFEDRMLSSHENRPHKCTLCRESFSLLKDLKMHLKVHLKVHRKLFSCDLCSKTFSQSADLRRHLHTHTGERPYCCTWCPKSFSQRGNLKRHLRTHTGERPYQCSFCARAFSYGDALKKHLRRHYMEKLCNKSFTADRRGSTAGIPCAVDSP